MDGVLVSVLLGLGVPAVAVTLWELFAAPRARFRPPLAGVPAVKALVLGGSVAAVCGTGHPVVAGVFAVVLALNTGFAEYYRSRPPAHLNEPRPVTATATAEDRRR